MKFYRLLTGPDDAAFCERIERMINLGWDLHGTTTITFNGVNVVAAQAITKSVDGEYSGFVHLDNLHPQAG